jgi:mRNA interferase MazF
VRRGEVWWGKTESTRRPYVILTRDVVLPLLANIVVAPTTTTIRSLPTEVVLDRSDGMPERCVVSLDNLTLFPKRSLGRRITTLGGSRLDEICEALTFALGCGS